MASDDRVTPLTRGYNGRVRRAVAPGRVNLIGEYTDIVGGHVLPVAIQLGTTVTFEADEGDRVELRWLDLCDQRIQRTGRR